MENCLCLVTSPTILWFLSHFCAALLLDLLDYLTVTTNPNSIYRNYTLPPSTQHTNVFWHRTVMDHIFNLYTICQKIFTKFCVIIKWVINIGSNLYNSAMLANQFKFTLGLQERFARAQRNSGPTRLVGCETGF